MPLNLPLRCRCGRMRGVASHVSPSSGFRFVCYCKDHEADSRSRDEVLGPPLCRIYERSAAGSLPPNVPGPPSLGVFARRASMMLGWWVRGLGRPTPFFDDRTKAPHAVPRGLTQSEHAALSGEIRKTAALE